MRMKIPYTYVLALGITAAIAGWMATGSVVIGGRAGAQNATPPPAERNAEAADKPFRVAVRTISAMSRRETLEIRGRTEADNLVEVKSETSGRVSQRHVREGAAVAAGDLLCELDRGARESKLAEQKARLEQAEFDYKAATRLKESGYSAATRVAAQKATLDAARAGVREAEIELERTEIRAPIAGTVETPIAEVGAMLAIGQTCATIIDTDPLKVIGQVSERDIAKLAPGMEATVALVTGETVTGTIRFIAAGADPQTRTFRVETEIANADKALRAGITASASVELKPTRAHFISAGILTLDDAGTMGVRAVGDGGRVDFHPVKIVGTERDGVWVSGLPDRLDVITVGQDYVKAGQMVEAVDASEGKPLKVGASSL